MATLQIIEIVENANIESFEQKKQNESDFKNQAIEKAISLGYKGNDYKMAIDFIMNTPHKPDEILKADWFDGHHSDGSMKYTLPISGEIIESGEFYCNEQGEIQNDAIDADGKKYLFIW